MFVIMLPTLPTIVVNMSTPMRNVCDQEHVLDVTLRSRRSIHLTIILPDLVMTSYCSQKNTEVFGLSRVQQVSTCGPPLEEGSNVKL